METEGWGEGPKRIAMPSDPPIADSPKPAAFRVVSVESTPNPNATKFILDRAVSAQPQSYFTRESGRGNPLAEKLFAIEGVTSLLLLNDFITVNKAPQAQWKAITAAVKRALALPS